MTLPLPSTSAVATGFNHLLIPGLSIVLTGGGRISSWEYLLQPMAAAQGSTRQENEPTIHNEP